MAEPSSCPRAGAYAVGIAFLPRRRCAEGRGHLRRSRRSPARGPRRLAWPVDRPVNPGRRPHRASVHAPPFAARPSAPPARAAARHGERKLYVPAQARRARGRRLLPVAVGCAPSSTRACSPPRSSTTFFPTCPTSGFDSALALVHSRFSTNTFPSWDRSRTRTATSRTTARSTRSRATATGCARARRCWPSDLIPGDLDRGSLFPICTDRRQRLGVVRRGPRAAAPRRPPAAARDDDDDPGGVVRTTTDHGPARAGVLPVPRRAHGAVGRPAASRSPTAP